MGLLRALCESLMLGAVRWITAGCAPQELEAHGIWDFDRLCEPWITDEVLQEVFGAELAPEVAARYLQEQTGGRYRFRAAYARCAGARPACECFCAGRARHQRSEFVGPCCFAASSRSRLCRCGAALLLTCNLRTPTTCGVDCSRCARMWYFSVTPKTQLPSTR